MDEPKLNRVALVEIQDRKVLVAKSRGGNMYYLPGGKIESGESDEQALIREVREELNVNVDPGSLVQLAVFEAPAHGKSEGMLMRMACFQAKYSGTPAPTSEIESLDWFDYSKKTIMSAMGQIVFEDLKSKDLID